MGSLFYLLLCKIGLLVAITFKHVVLIFLGLILNMAFIFLDNEWPFLPLRLSVNTLGSIRILLLLDLTCIRNAGLLPPVSLIRMCLVYKHCSI